MAPNVTVHFWAANDINGTPLLEITDEDEFFRGLKITPDLYGLGGWELTLARRVGFALFDSGAVQPEVFVRFLVHAWSDTDYYFGGSLSKRQQTVIHREEDGEEVFTFGGPGPKQYMDRYRLGIEQLTGTGWNLDLDNGVWRWNETATAGRVLNRIIAEDAAAADPSLPDLTKTFGDADDSDSNPWTNDVAGAGEYEIPIGQSLLTTIFELEDLSELTTVVNLGAVASPLYQLEAFEAYGDDVASGTFGVGVGLFREGVNIANDSLVVEGVSLRKATHVIIEGKDGAWATKVAPSWSSGEYIKWEKISYPRSSNVNILERAGLRWIRRQENGDKQLTVEIVPGASEATGFYFPGPGEVIWTGNTIALDTSADGLVHTPLDYTNEDQLVTSLELHLGPAGDTASSDAKAKSWDVKVKLNGERGGFAQSPNQATTGTTPSRGIQLCDNDSGFIETDTTWSALNIIGVSPPAGWNEVGFDDSDWTPAEVYAAVGAYVMPMGTDDTGRKVPSDKILLRREYFIDDDDLTGAAVVFQYALDNAGVIYVNGVAVVTLGPDFTDTAGHYTGNHATTIARSNFRSGFNCIAIYANNDAAGSSGATPPGATSGAVYIEMPTTNGDGGDARAARCDHHHHAGEIDETVDGNVQERLDELAAAIAAGTDDDALEADRALHGRFVATYHRASDGVALVMYSDDGITFRDGAQIDVNGSRRDPSLIHWDGTYWVILTHGTTSLRLYSSTDLETWTGPITITVDAGATQSWAPEWIRNLDGTPYLHPSTGLPCATVNVSTDSETTFTVREIHLTNRAMSAWSSPVTVTGTGLPGKMIDAFLLVDGDDYWLWYKNEGANKRIELATSSTALTSGYTVLESGDWAGWYAARDGGANSIEGPCVVRLDDGRWRIYFNENNGFDSIRAVYSETTDDWRTGTSTWTTQAVIVTDALMSHGTVNRIASVYDHQRDPDAHGGVVTDHGGLTGLSDDDHTQYLNDARHTTTDHSAVVESAGRWEPVTNGVDTFVWDGAEIVVHFVET